MGLSFKSPLKHFIFCCLAQWYRVGSVTNSERISWFEYSQIILFLSFMIFFLFTRKVLGFLFSIECLT